MTNYYKSKLSDINYKMAIHEGDANTRLASEAIKILLLPPNEVPKAYQKLYNELISLIKMTYNKSRPTECSLRLGRIRNKTAAKYIKLLWTIEKNSFNLNEQ